MNSEQETTEDHTVNMQLMKQTQESAALTVDEVTNQIKQVQNLMSQAMKVDEHYGCIPGCGNKPTLLKPGAEKPREGYT